MTKKPEHNHNREKNLGMFEKALKHLFLDSTPANHSKPDTLMPPQLHTMSGVNTSTRNQKHKKNIHFHKTEKDNAFLSWIPNLRNHRVMKCSHKQTKTPPNNMNVLISPSIDNNQPLKAQIFLFIKKYRKGLERTEWPLVSGLQGDGPGL